MFMGRTCLRSIFFVGCLLSGNSTREVRSPDVAPTATCTLFSPTLGVEILSSGRTGAPGAGVPSGLDSLTKTSVPCALAHYSDFSPLVRGFRTSRGQQEMETTGVMEVTPVVLKELGHGCAPPERLPLQELPRPYLLVLPRGHCSFEDKLRTAQRLGAAALLVTDYPDSGSQLPAPDLTAVDPGVAVPLVVAPGSIHALMFPQAVNRGEDFQVSDLSFQIAVAPPGGRSMWGVEEKAGKGAERNRATSGSSTSITPVVTILPVGLGATIVEPIVRGVAERRPGAQITVYVIGPEPPGLTWLLAAGQDVTARIVEIEACNPELTRALHVSCAHAILAAHARGRPQQHSTLFLHPSFDVQYLDDALAGFDSVMRRQEQDAERETSAVDPHDSSNGTITPTGGEAMTYEGVALASEGIHWRCNGALVFSVLASELLGNDSSAQGRLVQQPVLPWSLCRAQCGSEAEELHRGRQRFTTATSGMLDPAIDVVIPAHEKDRDVLQRVVAGAWEHVVGVRRVVVVSRTRLCAQAEFFDEAWFPFNMSTVLEILEQQVGITAETSLSPPGWYLQQLIKLYAPLVIPNMTEHVLVLDADTVFGRATRFLEPVDGAAGRYTEGPDTPVVITESNQGTTTAPSSRRKRELVGSIGSSGMAVAFIVTGDESSTQIAHMGRLMPGLDRQHPAMSAIAHHMLLSKSLLVELHREVAEAHGGAALAEAFLGTLDPAAEHKKSASEFEIYFNYHLLRRPERTRVRQSSWCNGMKIALPPGQEFYDFVSFHDTFARKGRCEAFCCCGE